MLASIAIISENVITNRYDWVNECITSFEMKQSGTINLL
jgi:hypothetical protein